eukprot:m.642142 g.642142  ORF g.642142 m.642142 type:complete len:283 (-) comp22635_c0_seq10:797-1645(-)
MESSPITQSSLDELHQMIHRSFQSMKSTNTILQRLTKAAAAWQQKMTETAQAQKVFYSILDEVSNKAHDSPAMADLGVGFNNLSDCAKSLQEMHNDVHRALGDEIVIPMSARIPVDQRNIGRMEKDYTKYCAEQAELIQRAEKALDKASKRARRNTADARVVSQAQAAQRNLNDQVTELDALRAHTLKRVLTEERGRYAKLMGGVLDVLKVESKRLQRSTPALQVCIRAPVVNASDVWWLKLLPCAGALRGAVEYGHGVALSVGSVWFGRDDLVHIVQIRLG